jgi:threonine aldolase
MIDLRSDTITKPTPKMLVAMTTAEVGDDVFAEDETVNTFQNKIAAMFGMEAGLFVPSGVMSNQIAIKVLTHPGDEIIIDETGHIYNYETGGASFLSGVQIQTLSGLHGKLTPEMLDHRKRGNFDWEPRTTVLCLENTTNKGGGACYSKDELELIKKFADKEGLLIHLYGARIWNAMISTGIESTFFGEIADSISVCFSKGLGAPIGSMLLSSKERIAQARRYRKMWGGGMRQVGLLAAAADYAVENHWPLLAEDHRRAKLFAKAVSNCSKLEIDTESVESNIVIFDVKDGDAGDALSKFEKEGIRLVPFGPKTIRATFHFQLTDTQFTRLLETTGEIFG